MTLRSKTALLMAMVVALAIVVSGFFSLSLFEQSLRHSILQGAESLASSTAESIDRYLEQTVRDAEAIAAQLPNDLLQKRDLNGLAAFLRGAVRNYPHFENGLFILTPQGDLLADFPVHSELHGKNFAFREYYRRALEERTTIIGKPYVSARTGLLVLTFTAPLWDESHQLVGLLNGSVQLASPQALGGITQRHFGDTGYLYVYDSSRLMILHPQPQRIGKRDVPVGANRLFDKALQGFEGAGETVNSRGVRMLAAFTRSKKLDWVVAAQQPASEAFAPLRQARFKILLVLLASAALAAGIGVLAVRRVTWPLIRLQVAARHLGCIAPDKTAELADAGAALAELERKYAGGEIGSLAQTLREQQQQLGESVGALHDAAEHWERTFNSVQDAIFVVDKECRIQRLNRAARELFKLPGDEALGMPCYRLIHGSDRPPASCPGLQTLASGRPEKMELTDSLLPGVYEETTTLLAETAQGGPAIVHLLKDLSQIKENEAQIKRLAYYDPLTGLPNRSQFIERLDATLAAPRRAETCGGHVCRSRSVQDR
ncbi:MAG: cache domain-containing protein [Syntrophotaleaceae bacterium]